MLTEVLLSEFQCLHDTQFQFFCMGLGLLVNIIRHVRASEIHVAS